MTMRTTGCPAFSSAASWSLMRAVAFAFGTKVDEEAIVAVERHIAQRLTVDRDQALTVLAGGFRDQLFGPGAEIGDPFWTIVSSPCRGLRARRGPWRGQAARPDFGEAAHQARRSASSPARASAGWHVDARRCRRHQPERRQHGVAAADRRGPPWKIRAKPCLVATFSSDEPGSVTAMKRCPALSAPIASETRAKK